MPPNGRMHGLSSTLKSRAEAPVLMSVVYVWSIPELTSTTILNLHCCEQPATGCPYSCTFPYVLLAQSSQFQVANAALWQWPSPIY